MSTSTNRPADALRADDRTDAPKKSGGGAVGALSNWVDERTGAGGAAKFLMKKVFPDHWSFMLGEIALWSFVVVLLSGTFLTFFFQASMVETHYAGAYLPLRGVEMSAALDSTLRISFDIRGGLLVRQIHHWAALVFVAGIGVHMLRVFFTGAFRKPRELNWVIGFVLFILAMAEGFTGYSLPDDLLSGNGLRIIDGMMSIPSILLAIALMALTRGSIQNVIIAITIAEIPRVSRLVRGVVLSLREQPYVEAAVANGARVPRIIFRHILPNTFAPMSVQATYICASAMIVEAILSFIGAGVPPATPSWGNIMAEGRALWQVRPHIILFPAVFLSLTVLAVNMLGDGLRDALDPKTR